ELNRSMQQKEISEKVLRNTNHEKKQLQAQLMETISGFTEVIEGLNDQCPEGLTTTGGPPASVDRLQDQLREVSYQNQALQAELHNMRCHLEKLQDSRQAMEAKSRSAKNAGAGPEAQVHQLKDERDMLKVRLEELSSSSATLQQQDTQDQVHTQELKRHRQDVESLHNQKEELRRQLQDQDKERQELQDNFLYVKSQLDKVQMKQAQGDGSADGERELQRHRQTLDSVLEERSRLAHRLESVLRDAEKEKAYHEQSVERVMTANGRLMEERDRTAKEVERLSRLYAESVNQLQGDLNQTNMTSGIFRTDSGSSPLADPAVVAKVQGQLAEVEEAIRSKEQENESLKNRIRKLAVA
ncbi:unnamed protein product, partial [Polarella glacialis]